MVEAPPGSLSASTKTPRFVPDRARRRLDRRILDLVFPPRCAGCRRPGNWICPRCWPRVQWLRPEECAGCGRPTSGGVSCPGCSQASRGEGSSLVPFRAVARYEGIARQVIHELKYVNHFDIATVMAPLMAQRARVCARPHLIPVPLHSSRRRERGYNQSEILARHMSKSLGWPIDSTGLRRVQQTASQVGLDLDRRLTNVGTAFRWSGGFPPPSVLLIDDVRTSGATLAACATALRQAGVGQVEGLVFACRHVSVSFDHVAMDAT